MREERETLIIIKRIFLVLSGVLILVYLTGCSAPGMDRKKFVNFYADYITAQDSSGFNPEISAKIREGLYKKYGITAEEYEQTVNNLKENKTDWESFFNEVIAELEKRRDEEAKKSL
ncbi:MAG: DUF4296 domain-containing protein [Ignavibacteriaceae bacterium]|nr:DUF4296 domain-containing protein [Ignavibacteriaceae bacterium]